jgi:hypothetical protein
MNVFKALVVAERKQKTPLTLVDFDPPVLKVDEILVSNEAVAQVRAKSPSLQAVEFGLMMLENGRIL